MDVGSTIEVKGGLEEGCSSRDEFNGEYVQVVNDFHNSPTCLQIILSPRLECNSSFRVREKKYIEDVWENQIDVEHLRNHLQHLDDGNFEEDRILKRVEGVTREVISWVLHQEMMVMLDSQSIISYHEPNVFMGINLFFDHNLCSSSTYVFDEVCSQPVRFSQDTFFPQFDFQYQIGIWLEKSFMDRYPLCFNDHIMVFMNRMLDDLILSSLSDIVV